MNNNITNWLLADGPRWPMIGGGRRHVAARRISLKSGNEESESEREKGDGRTCLRVVIGSHVSNAVAIWRLPFTTWLDREGGPQNGGPTCGHFGCWPEKKKRKRKCDENPIRARRKPTNREAKRSAKRGTSRVRQPSRWQVPLGGGNMAAPKKGRKLRKKVGSVMTGRSTFEFDGS